MQAEDAGCRRLAFERGLRNAEIRGRAASVTGRVTDTAGQPLPDIPLALMGPDEAEDAEPRERTWTDEEGRFVLDAEAPGDYRIEVRDTPFVDTSFPVSAPSISSAVVPVKAPPFRGSE